MPTPTVGVTSRLISVSAQNNSTWTQRTADISDYIGCDARLVVLYQSGSSFTGDAQLDTFNIGGTTYNPTANGTTIGGASLQVTTNQPSPGADLDDINSEYNAITWSNIATAVTAGRWNRDGFGTPSGGTGNTSGNSGPYYIYAETSGIGLPSKWFWLRTPEVTITTSTLSLFTAQNGATCGPIYVYLDVTSVPSAPPLIVPVTGTSATSGLGSATIVAVQNITVEPTGESATAQIGVVDVNIQNTTDEGWGRGTWGSGAWSASLSGPETVLVTGVSATSAVGTVVVNANAGVPVTGLSSSSSIGDLTVTADANVSPTGVLATGAVGTATVEADANVPETGLQATGNVGSVTVTADANITETGLQATGAVGSVTVTADANVAETGLQATGNVGSVTVTADANVPEAGLQATGNVGSVTITADANVFPTGESSTGAVGSVVVTGTAVVTPSGLEATSGLGTVAVIAEANVAVTGVEATSGLGTVAVIAEEALLLRLTLMYSQRAKAPVRLEALLLQVQQLLPLVD
jgi:hypothetical protein